MDEQYLATCTTEELESHVKSEPASSEDEDGSDENDRENRAEDEKPTSTVACQTPVDGEEHHSKEVAINDLQQFSGSLEEADATGVKSGKIFRCRYCRYRVKHLHTLHKHEAAHREGRFHNCKLCSFSHPSEIKLKEHEWEHTGVKPFECEKCSYRSRYYVDLLKHKRVHSSYKKYSCHLCSFRCKWRGNLSKHLGTHSESRPYNCSLCDKWFKTKSILDSHMRVHSTILPFSCEDCGFKAKTKFEIKNHKLSHSDVRNFPCTFPGCTQRCKTNSDLRKHSVVHVTTLDCICHICKKGFKDMSRLKKHIQGHEEKGKEHLCPFCGKILYSKNGFRHHLYKHKSNKTFICNVCGHHSTSTTNIKVHMRVHDLSRSSQCPICRCRFKELDHLLVHIGQNHSDTYAYLCDLCKKPFGKLGSLRFHIQRCHKSLSVVQDFDLIYNKDCCNHFEEDTNTGQGGYCEVRDELTESTLSNISSDKPMCVISAMGTSAESSGAVHNSGLKHDLADECQEIVFKSVNRDQDLSGPGSSEERKLSAHSSCIQTNSCHRRQGADAGNTTFSNTDSNQNLKTTESKDIVEFNHFQCTNATTCALNSDMRTTESKDIVEPDHFQCTNATACALNSDMRTTESKDILEPDHFQGINATACALNSDMRTTESKDILEPDHFQGTNATACALNSDMRTTESKDILEPDHFQGTNATACALNSDMRIPGSKDILEPDHFQCTDAAAFALNLDGNTPAYDHHTEGLCSSVTDSNSLQIPIISDTRKSTPTVLEYSELLKQHGLLDCQVEVRLERLPVNLNCTSSSSSSSSSSSQLSSSDPWRVVSLDNLSVLNSQEKNSPERSVIEKNNDVASTAMREMMSTKVPSIVKLGTIGGVDVCLANKYSGLTFNYEKTGKKPRRWFMEPSMMPEKEAKKMRKYMRKKNIKNLLDSDNCDGRSNFRLEQNLEKHDNVLCEQITDPTMLKSQRKKTSPVAGEQKKKIILKPLSQQLRVSKTDVEMLENDGFEKMESERQSARPQRSAAKHCLKMIEAINLESIADSNLLISETVIRMEEDDNFIVDPEVKDRPISQCKATVVENKHPPVHPSAIMTNSRKNALGKECKDLSPVTQYDKPELACEGMPQSHENGKEREHSRAGFGDEEDQETASDIVESADDQTGSGKQSGGGGGIYGARHKSKVAYRKGSNVSDLMSCDVPQVTRSGSSEMSFKRKRSCKSSKFMIRNVIERQSYSSQINEVREKSRCHYEGSEGEIRKRGRGRPKKHLTDKGHKETFCLHGPSTSVLLTSPESCKQGMETMLQDNKHLAQNGDTQVCLEREGEINSLGKQNADKDNAESQVCNLSSPCQGSVPKRGRGRPRKCLVMKCVDLTETGHQQAVIQPGSSASDSVFASQNGKQKVGKPNKSQVQLQDCGEEFMQREGTQNILDINGGESSPRRQSVVNSQVEPDGHITAYTCQGGEVPKQGEEVPKQGKEVPKQGEEVPKQGKEVPKQGGEVPKQGGEVPKQDGEVPKQGGEVPKQGKEVPKQGGEVPKQGGEVPKQDGEVPKQGGEVPKQSGEVPKQCEEVPKQGGEVPKQSGEVPKQGGEVPKQSGEVPKQGGEVPKQGGEVPKQSGEVPKRGRGRPRKVLAMGCQGLIERAHKDTLSLNVPFASDSVPVSESGKRTVKRCRKTQAMLQSSENLAQDEDTDMTLGREEDLNASDRLNVVNNQNMPYATCQNGNVPKPRRGRPRKILALDSNCKDPKQKAHKETLHLQGSPASDLVSASQNGTQEGEKILATESVCKCTDLIDDGRRETCTLCLQGSSASNLVPASQGGKRKVGRPRKVKAMLHEINKDIAENEDKLISLDRTGNGNSSRGQSTVSDQRENAVSNQRDCVLADQRESAVIDQGQSAISDQGQSAYSDQGQSAYSDQGQSAYSDQGQSAYSDQGQSTYSDQGQSAYSDQEQSAYSDQGQSAYSDQGQSAYSDQGQSAYSDQGQSTYSDQGQSVYNDQRPSAYAYSDQRQSAISVQRESAVIACNLASTDQAGVCNPLQSNCTNYNSVEERESESGKSNPTLSHTLDIGNFVYSGTFASQSDATKLHEENMNTLVHQPVSYNTNYAGCMTNMSHGDPCSFVFKEDNSDIFQVSRQIRIGSPKSIQNQTQEMYEQENMLSLQVDHACVQEILEDPMLYNPCESLPNYFALAFSSRIAGITSGLHDGLGYADSLSMSNNDCNVHGTTQKENQKDSNVHDTTQEENQNDSNVHGTTQEEGQRTLHSSNTALDYYVLQTPTECTEESKTNREEGNVSKHLIQESGLWLSGHSVSNCILAKAEDTGTDITVQKPDSSLSASIGFPAPSALGGIVANHCNITTLSGALNCNEASKTDQNITAFLDSSELKAYGVFRVDEIKSSVEAHVDHKCRVTEKITCAKDSENFSTIAHTGTDKCTVKLSTALDIEDAELGQEDIRFSDQDQNAMQDNFGTLTDIGEEGCNVSHSKIHDGKTGLCHEQCGANRIASMSAQTSVEIKNPEKDGDAFANAEANFIFDLGNGDQALSNRQTDARSTPVSLNDYFTLQNATHNTVNVSDSLPVSEKVSECFKDQESFQARSEVQSMDASPSCASTCAGMSCLVSQVIITTAECSPPPSLSSLSSSSSLTSSSTSESDPPGQSITLPWHAHDSQMALPSQSHDSQTPLPPQSHDSQTALPSQSHDSQTPLPSQSHDSQTPLLSQSHDAQTPLPPQSHDAQTPLPPQSHDAQTPLPPQSHDAQTAVPPQSHDAQTPLPPQSYDSQTTLPPQSYDSQTSLPPQSYDSSVPENSAIGHESSAGVMATPSSTSQETIVNDSCVTTPMSLTDSAAILEPVVKNTQEPGMENIQEPVVKSTQERVLKNTEEAAVKNTHKPGMKNMYEPGMETTQEPGRENTHEPEMENIQAPGMENTQEPGMKNMYEPGMENTQKPGMENTQGPGMENVQEPRLENTQEPGMENTQEPGMENIQEPGMENVQEPRMENTQEPGMENTQEPGIENTQEPGMENTQKPGMENTQKPGMENIQEPGMEKSQEPEMENTQEPGMENIQEPGMENVQEPRMENTQEPGMENTQEPGIENTQEPGMENTQKPGMENTQKPGMENIQEPGMENTQEPEMENTQEPGMENIQEPVVKNTQEPGIENTQASSSFTEVEESVTNVELAKQSTMSKVSGQPPNNNRQSIAKNDHHKPINFPSRPVTVISLEEFESQYSKKQKVSVKAVMEECTLPVSEKIPRLREAGKGIGRTKIKRFRRSKKAIKRVLETMKKESIVKVHKECSRGSWRRISALKARQNDIEDEKKWENNLLFISEFCERQGSLREVNPVHEKPTGQVTEPSFQESGESFLINHSLTYLNSTVNTVLGNVLEATCLMDSESQLMKSMSSCVTEGIESDFQESGGSSLINHSLTYLNSTVNTVAGHLSEATCLVDSESPHMKSMSRSETEVTEPSFQERGVASLINHSLTYLSNTVNTVSGNLSQATCVMDSESPHMKSMSSCETRAIESSFQESGGSSLINHSLTYLNSTANTISGDFLEATCLLESESPHMKSMSSCETETIEPSFQESGESSLINHRLTYLNNTMNTVSGNVLEATCLMDSESPHMKSMSSCETRAIESSFQESGGSSLINHSLTYLNSSANTISGDFLEATCLIESESPHMKSMSSCETAAIEPSFQESGESSLINHRLTYLNNTMNTVSGNVLEATCLMDSESQHMKSMSSCETEVTEPSFQETGGSSLINHSLTYLNSTVNTVSENLLQTTCLMESENQHMKSMSNCKTEGNNTIGKSCNVVKTPSMIVTDSPSTDVDKISTDSICKESRDHCDQNTDVLENIPPAKLVQVLAECGYTLTNQNCVVKSTPQHGDGGSRNTIYHHTNLQSGKLRMKDSSNKKTQTSLHCSQVIMDPLEVHVSTSGNTVLEGKLSIMQEKGQTDVSGNEESQTELFTFPENVTGGLSFSRAVNSSEEESLSKAMKILKQNGYRVSSNGSVKRIREYKDMKVFQSVGRHQPSDSENDASMEAGTCANFDKSRSDDSSIAFRRCRNSGEDDRQTGNSAQNSAYVLSELVVSQRKRKHLGNGNRKTHKLGGSSAANKKRKIYQTLGTQNRKRRELKTAVYSLIKLNTRLPGGYIITKSGHIRKRRRPAPQMSSSFLDRTVASTKTKEKVSDFLHLEATTTRIDCNEKSAINVKNQPCPTPDEHARNQDEHSKQKEQLQKWHQQQQLQQQQQQSLRQEESKVILDNQSPTSQTYSSHFQVTEHLRNNIGGKVETDPLSDSVSNVTNFLPKGYVINASGYISKKQAQKLTVNNSAARSNDCKESTQDFVSGNMSIDASIFSNSLPKGYFVAENGCIVTSSDRKCSKDLSFENGYPCQEDEDADASNIEKSGKMNIKFSNLAGEYLNKNTPTVNLMKRPRTLLDTVLGNDGGTLSENYASHNNDNETNTLLTCALRASASSYRSQVTQSALGASTSSLHSQVTQRPLGTSALSHHSQVTQSALGASTSSLNLPMTQGALGVSTSSLYSQSALGASTSSHHSQSALGASISSLYSQSALGASTSSLYSQSALGASTSSHHSQSALGASISSLYSQSALGASTSSLYSQSALGASTSSLYSQSALGASTSSLHSQSALGASTSSLYSQSALGASISSLHSQSALGASTSSLHSQSALGASISSLYSQSALGASTSSHHSQSALGASISSLYSQSALGASTSSLHSQSALGASTSSHHSQSALGASTSSLYSQSALGASTSSLYSQSALGVSTSSLYSQSALGASTSSLYSQSALGVSTSSLYSQSALGASTSSLYSQSALGASISSLHSQSALGASISSHHSQSALGASTSPLHSQVTQSALGTYTIPLHSQNQMTQSSLCNDSLKLNKRLPDGNVTSLVENIAQGYRGSQDNCLKKRARPRSHDKDISESHSKRSRFIQDSTSLVETRDSQASILTSAVHFVASKAGWGKSCLQKEDTFVVEAATDTYLSNMESHPDLHSNVCNMRGEVEQPDSHRNLCNTVYENGQHNLHRSVCNTSATATQGQPEYRKLCNADIVEKQTDSYRKFCHAGVKEEQPDMHNNTDIEGTLQRQAHHYMNSCNKGTVTPTSDEVHFPKNLQMSQADSSYQAFTMITPDSVCEPLAPAAEAEMLAVNFHITEDATVDGKVIHLGESSKSDYRSASGSAEYLNTSLLLDSSLFDII